MDSVTEIQDILIHRSWRLIHPEPNSTAWNSFVAAVQVILAGPAESDNRYGSTSSRLDRAVTYAYCPILLAACRDSGSDRQERAFTELWEWIYPRVFARINHAQDTEDVAQKVLVKVYQNLRQVLEPHGFLGWVSVIMQREIIDYYRGKGRINRFEQEPPGNGDDNDDDGMDDLIGPDSFLEHDIRVVEQELIRMIYDCMPKKKWRRAKVLVALTLLEQTTAEVAESLQITTNAVYMLHFYAKSDLPQHCPELIEFILQQLTPSQRSRATEGIS